MLWEFSSCVQFRCRWQAIIRRDSRLQNASIKSCKLKLSRPEHLLTFIAEYVDESVFPNLRIVLQEVMLTTVVLLQPLRWCCVDCVSHHERDVREEEHHTYTWREQAIIEWSWHVNSIVPCCHSAKLCAYAARDFRSQQYLVSIANCERSSRKLKLILSYLWASMSQYRLCDSFQECRKRRKSETAFDDETINELASKKARKVLLLLACCDHLNKKRLDTLMFWWNCVFRTQVIYDLH